MVTTTIPTEQEILLGQAVTALQATGQDGLVRSVPVIARVFEFISANEFLSKAEVRIRATETRAARMGNLPTHKRLVWAAYAFHTLGSETDAEEVLNWTALLGEQVLDLASAKGQSAEVRASVLRGLYEAKATERASRIADAAEARKQIVAVAPKVAVLLLEAEGMLGAEFQLDANTADELRKAYDSLGRMLGLN